MLTLIECKKHFKQSKIAYTDEQIEKIRDFLYEMAHIQVEYEQKIIKAQNNNDHERDTILSGEYRRAS